jgi:hypothetical protein
VEATAFNHGFQAMVAMKMKLPGMEIVQLIVGLFLWPRDRRMHVRTAGS